MRKAFITLTSILAASSFAVGSQLPLGQDKVGQVGRPMSDPSFPQQGLAGFDDLPSPQGGPGATLAEALTVDRRAGIWWDYARDVSSITARLSARGARDTTIFVPVDSAIMKLSRKPHQSPDGEDSEETMKKNVEDFLSAHIVPGSVDLPTKGPAQTLLGDVKLEIVADESNEGSWRVQPGNIAVLDVKQAANGQIIWLDGVVQV